MAMLRKPLMQNSLLTCSNHLETGGTAPSLLSIWRLIMDRQGVLESILLFALAFVVLVVCMAIF